MFEPEVTTVLAWKWMDRKKEAGGDVSLTVANQGAGAYPATARSYRVQWRRKAGALVKYQNAPGKVTAFTPSGAHGAARVTQPTAPSWATHWVVFGRLDGTTDDYLLSEIIVATTVYDDSADPANYSAGAIPASVDATTTAVQHVNLELADNTNQARADLTTRLWLELKP